MAFTVRPNPIRNLNAVITIPKDRNERTLFVIEIDSEVVKVGSFIKPKYIGTKFYPGAITFWQISGRLALPIRMDSIASRLKEVALADCLNI